MIHQPAVAEHSFPFNFYYYLSIQFFPKLSANCRMKVTIAALFLICFLHRLQAQQDPSCQLQISLLTCSPGEELYSTFGHSALRVKDSATKTDIIYNYGTFDFDDPDFYS